MQARERPHDSHRDSGAYHRQDLTRGAGQPIRVGGRTCAEHAAQISARVGNAFQREKTQMSSPKCKNENICNLFLQCGLVATTDRSARVNSFDPIGTWCMWSRPKAGRVVNQFASRTGKCGGTHAKSGRRSSFCQKREFLQTAPWGILQRHCCCVYTVLACQLLWDMGCAPDRAAGLLSLNTPNLLLG